MLNEIREQILVEKNEAEIQHYLGDVLKSLDPLFLEFG
jgi:hypothetical protein